MEKKDIVIKNLEKMIQNVKEENRRLKDQAEIHEENFNQLTILKKRSDAQLKENQVEAVNFECELIGLKEQFVSLQKHLMLITEEKQKEQCDKSDSFVPVHLHESNINTSSFDIAASPTNNNYKSNVNNLRNELKEIGGSMNSLDFFNFSKTKQDFEKGEINLIEEKKDEKNLEKIKLLEGRIEELQNKNEEYERSMEEKLKEMSSEQFKKINVIKIVIQSFLIFIGLLNFRV